MKELYENGIKIIAPPRLTTFLRYQSNISRLPEDNDYDLAKVLAVKREERRRQMREHGASWVNIKQIIKDLGKENGVNLQCYIRDVEEVARLIAPEPDTREEVALLLFTLCYMYPVLPNRNKMKLKNVVGEVKPSLVDKAHKAILNIVELIGKEEICDAMESMKLDGTSQNIFGQHIKVGSFGMKPMLPNASKLLRLKTNRRSKDVGLSLNFEDYKPSVEADELTSKPKTKVRLKEEVFDRSWVEAEMLNYYTETAMISELANVTVSLLLGTKSNMELENELFDFLGFDRFELIQTLLSNREKLKSFIPEKEQKIQEIRNELERQTVDRVGFGQQVTVMSESEKQYLKQARKEDKKMMKTIKNVADQDVTEDFNPEELKLKRENALLEATQMSALKSLTRGSSSQPEARLPYVFDNYSRAKESAGFIAGTKLYLPEGFRRTSDNVKEEVEIPTSEPAPADVGSKFVAISSLDEIGRIAFRGCETLNRIQTVVYPIAYHTNENLLICAPTGAGKTNIAMLTVIHQIRQHFDCGVIQKDKFKIVYVAPMKALAAEMARNFSKRLEPLGIMVKELTGDMHLTKPEIMATNMIITTPEKWDVTTRKPGDTQLSQLVKLLIIDEVHLLHGDRGPVLETLVARTLRMVESQQSMIRIVGLSATLPNYRDISSFLRVNPYKGLFFFDGRFRPVPLGLTFTGIKSMSRLQQLDEMDRATFEKSLHFVMRGHQVMVFVHSRNGTLKTAQNMIKLAQEQGKTEEFLPENLPDVGRARKDLQRSRNKKLLELFDSGLGVHHAGLLRQDRNLIESLFQRGFIKVLVTTATLAWGVNLPAHAVIIKGTDIYDSKHGGMVDLGILDVLQIFGRAGRPQYDKSGHGTIITTHDKLSHYLTLLTNQYPIESSFINHLADNLNAEISLGNVTNIDEAVEWLSYTYLYVRMRKSPQSYGLKYVDVQNDPTLELYRRKLIMDAARALDRAHMIRLSEPTGYLYITDLGRIASQFYIKYDTVEVFNSELRQVMNEADILATISRASEFSQLKVRDEELSELDQLHPMCEVPARGGVENVDGKVNILIQTFISRHQVEGFSLVSDMNYVTDNSVRIARALFEIVLHKSWSLLSARFLEMAKMLERRMWNFESPLRQFVKLSQEIIDKIEDRRLTVMRIRDMDYKEIGKMIRHERMGREVLQTAWQFPLLSIDATIHPITRTVLRIKLNILPDFRWNDKVHGSQESYWIWVEDPISNHMYHHEQFILTKKQVIREEAQHLVFTIPIFEPLPSQYYVKAISDRWLGCESMCALNFEHLILPERHPPHTDLLDLEPLPVTALNDSRLELLYKFTHFNPIQTQLFHCLYHTDNNVLLGAPTGSGKTIAAEIAMFRVFREAPKTKIVYIAPLKALVRERVDDWKVRLGEKLDKKVVELTGDVSPDVRAIQASDVIITTPEKWDGISRSWQTRNYVKQVSLIVIDEIHLLGEDRGPVLEVIVSRTNFISNHTNRTLRIIGLSTALANAKDLADWLEIGQMGLFNFRPSVRPVPLEVHIAGFPGKHYCPRMATMNKPTFQAIRQHSPDKPCLVFVSSRRQTRLTALDLMGFVVTEPDPKQWLRMPEHEMDQILNNVKDENLRLCLSFGIGLHHAGLVERDRKIVEELFVNQKIQILITTSTLAWGVNFPAHLVVIKGTEYYDGKTKRYVDFPITDVLQMMGRAGRPQYDDHGVAVILVQDQKKYFYKKFLYEPFPVESSLLNVLPDHLNAEIVAGTINTKQEALDYLTWTYFFRRLAQNPSYYNLELEEGDNSNEINKFLSYIVDKSIVSLENSFCVEVANDNRTLEATPLGRIASFYYLNHETMQLFKEKLHKDVTINDLLLILTEAHEYDELPVRHNEDNLNGELAKRCPVEVNPYTYDSPHTKAHLLLQSHMSRIPLPCVDYLTDTKSVLDQAFRILQAMLDVCGCAGWLAAALQTQLLMQMIMQARWHSDSTILILPFITHDILYCFRHKNLVVNNIPQLMEIVRGNYETLASMLRDELEEGQIEVCFQVLQQLPVVNVSLSLNGRFQEKEEETEVEEESEGEISCQECSKTIDISSQRNESNPAYVTVHASEDYSLTVYLHRVNKSRDMRVHAPKFSKPKDESWFLVLGEIESGELLALKRISPIRGKATHSIVFRTPSNPGQYMLTIYLISDSYLGLDQQYYIPLNVIYPLEQLEVINDSLLDLDVNEVDSKKWMPPNEEPIFTGRKGEEKSLDTATLESSFPELKASSGPSNKQKEANQNGSKNRKKKKH